MEEMMKELGLEEMLDEDMEDDDDDDDEMVGPMGRAPAMVMPSPSAGDTTGE